MPDVYIYIYIYRDVRVGRIYRDSASVESTRGGSLTLAPIILDHHGVVIKFQRSKYAATTGSLRLQVE